MEHIFDTSLITWGAESLFLQVWFSNKPCLHNSGDKSTLEELLVESDFYQLKELAQHIEKHFNKDKKIQYCKVLCNGDWIGQVASISQ